MSDNNHTQPDSRPVLERLASIVRDGQTARDVAGVQRAYRDGYAVEREDGALLGAVRVTPANMSTKDDREWQQQIDTLARILASTFDFPAQWFNCQRSVDYESRRETYSFRESVYRRRRRRRERVSQRDPLPVSILADVCEERAAVVDLLQETTMTREYYIIVSVEPEEALVSPGDDEGLASVPGLGRFVTKQRLEQEHRSPEHIRTLADKLTNRVDDVASTLRTLEGVSAHPLSSTEFSRVIADYYRGEDVYAYTDFTAAVLDTPIPHPYTDEVNQPDPEYDVGYYRRDNSGVRATDGGVRTVNPICDDDELEYRYRGLLTPDLISRYHPRYITLDYEWHSTTLSIRDWPSVPPIGMLEPILNFELPGVRITVSTHFQGKNIDKERRQLKSKADSLRIKAEKAEEWGSPLAEKRRKEAEAANDIKDSVEETDVGLFTTNTYIELRSRDPDRLEGATKQIKSRLKELNANAKERRRDHTRGYQTVAPICDEQLSGAVTMSGEGLAKLIPWTSNNLIEPGGVEIGTHADRNEPTVIDLFGRDTGFNIGLFGTIGSGKTTTLKMLLLRHKLRNQDTRLVLVDPLQEFTGLCDAFEGKHIVIGGETSINPLHIEPTPEDKLSKIGASTPLKDAKRRAMTFIETYYDLENLTLGAKRGVWQRAIAEAYRSKGITRDPSTHEAESPTLQDAIGIIEDMVSNPEAYVRESIETDEDTLKERKRKAIDILNNDIEPLAEGGVHYHLTQPTDIDIADSDVIYLDLQRYEGEAKTGLMMQLLVSQIYEQAKTSDTRTVMAMDESHYMLRNSTDLAFLKQAVRHSRHHDLSLMFSTQSVSEFFAETESGEEELTNDAKIIVDNMSIKCFHYLKEMNASWADEFGLSENEMQFVQEADPGNEAAGYAEMLLQVDQAGCFPLRVEMSDELNPREFALIRYDASTHGDLRAYLQQACDDWGWA